MNEFILNLEALLRWDANGRHPEQRPIRNPSPEAISELERLAGPIAVRVVIADPHPVGDRLDPLFAHGDEPPIPHEFDDKLRAALPLWTNLKVAGKLSDIVMKAPFGQAKAKSVAETISLSGLTAPATAEFGVQVDSVTIDSSQAPPWAAKLTPASLDFDLKFSGGGFDQAAQIALDDPSFAANGELSPEAQEKIDAALFGGHPRLTLAPGRISTPTFNLAYEGEASAVAGDPSGRLVVTADGLDKALALLQEIAGSDPEAEAAILSLTYAKGLAKPGPDGRLTWTIELKGGEVTVNGSPLPIGK